MAASPTGMRLAVCVLCVAASARADDGLSLHAGPRDAEPAPQLTLDPLLEARFETLHADEDTTAARIPLGHHLAVQLENTAWSNRDIAARGWRSVAGITADHGHWHLSALASWNGVDGRFGGGRYTDYGVSLARTFRLSRWMTAWIALSIAHRQWSDTPPVGERDGTAVMLTIGTTFR